VSAARRRLVPLRAERDPRATVRIGISGWRYAGWRGVFYPPGLPQRRELEYASRRFGSLEINGSFYSRERGGGVARQEGEEALEPRGVAGARPPRDRPQARRLLLLRQ